MLAARYAEIPCMEGKEDCKLRFYDAEVGRSVTMFADAGSATRSSGLAGHESIRGTGMDYG
jgi:hypothetical protein